LRQFIKGRQVLDFSYIAAGALTGLVVGLTGVGGGALMTPILLIFFGISPVTAIATDLWFAAITKIIGALVHHQAGQVDWQVVKRLWMGSLPVALAIVILVSSGEMISKVNWLTSAIGMLVLVTAIGLMIAPRIKAIAHHRRVAHAQEFKSIQPLLTVVSGGVLGICVALTSVGAGALGSLLLLYLYPLRMTPHRLVATDIVHAIPLAVVAGLGYLFAGKVDGVMLVNLLLGSIPTVILGSFLAKKISSRALQISLATVLLLVGVKLIL
jgi:uncharacterized membrane protein YfcA